MTKNELRRHMRAKRRALSAVQRERAARNLSRQLSPLLQRRRYQRLAFYLANDGELSPHYLLKSAWRQRRQCFLPVVHHVVFSRMSFAPYAQNSRMKKNCYGISEPDVVYSKMRLGQTLDVLFMPLVAFDEKGNRLGMGGGYYDRTFSYLRRRKSWRRPILIGIAYDFQQVDVLPVESWDVPLDGIVTESRLLRFK